MELLFLRASSQWFADFPFEKFWKQIDNDTCGANREVWSFTFHDKWCHLSLWGVITKTIRNIIITINGHQCLIECLINTPIGTRPEPREAMLTKHLSDSGNKEISETCNMNLICWYAWSNIFQSHKRFSFFNGPAQNNTCS